MRDSRWKCSKVVLLAKNMLDTKNYFLDSLSNERGICFLNTYNKISEFIQVNRICFKEKQIFLQNVCSNNC